MTEPITPVNPTAMAAPVAPVAQPTPVVAPVAPIVQAQVASQPAPTFTPQQPTNTRTAEQFEKLLETNRLLNQELIRRSQANQAFQPIQAAPVAPAPVEPNVADFTRVDPISGEEYIDKGKLQNALQRAQQEAMRGQETATRAEQAMRNYVEAANGREIERQNKETFTVYPELNPQGKNFDTRFHAQVRGILTDSFLNTREYGGRPLTFIEAAQFIKGTGNQQPSQQQVVPTPQGGVQQPTAQELKEQASLSIPSQPQQVLPSSANDETIKALSEKTRYGDDKALAERLKYTEHILPRGAE